MLSASERSEQGARMKINNIYAFDKKGQIKGLKKCFKVNVLGICARGS
jgi:hypothetical protein